LERIIGGGLWQDGRIDDLGSCNGLKTRHKVVASIGELQIYMKELLFHVESFVIKAWCPCAYGKKIKLNKLVHLIEVQERICPKELIIV
jgi:hypothetical protein